jgi:arylsulfatase A-like enzyme
MKMASSLAFVVLLGAPVLTGAAPRPAGATPPASLQPPRHVGPPLAEQAVTNRAFTGIPSLAVAPQGRLWATWYAGVTPAEDLNNYVVLSTSGDGGSTWQEVLTVDPDGGGPVRAFDPELWVSPDGRLFFFWAQMEKGRRDTEHGVWCVETAAADAPQPAWSQPRRIGDGVMMCKPLVLSSGEWVLPVSRWKEHEESAGCVVSTDGGRTWTRRGGCHVPKDVRQYDEHMFVERKDRSLWLLVRTTYGIGQSVSTDRGATWPALTPSGIPHTVSRFFISRLASGSLLLVKHGPLDARTGRSHLMAFVSTDDGRTWRGGLMLDERPGVSYPDGQQTPDGRIRIVYDYNRVSDREILMATFREEDVAAARDVSGGVRLRQRVSRASGGQEKPVVSKEAVRPNADGQPLRRARPGSLASDGTQAEPPRPNIIVILADDLGYADIGVHGCSDIPTPHIDSLATRGVRFTAAYANGSFCTPTRAALMACRYQHRYGIEDLGGPLPAEAVTLPQRLEAAGYVTGMVGKWHLGVGAGFTPVDRGFAEFFGFLGGGHQYVPQPGGKGEYHAPILRNRDPVAETRYLTDAFGAEAAAFVTRPRDGGAPFFLYLAFNAVHTPLQTTNAYRHRFPAIQDTRRQTYAAMLSAMDDAVGLVLAALDKTGQRDNTLIMFTSDNGGPTTRNAVNGSRNTPLRGSKCETFEGGIRVPLLMQWPRVLEAGGTYARPVITFDLAATALAAAGGDATDSDGVDLVPFVTGRRAGDPHDTLFWRSRTMSDNFAARQGDWKFVHSTEGAAEPGPNQTPARDMLFNLATDISERHDLADKHPDRLAALRRRYEAWSAEVDADCRRLGLKPKTATPASGVQPQ